MCFFFFYLPLQIFLCDRKSLVLAVYFGFCLPLYLFTTWHYRLWESLKASDSCQKPWELATLKYKLPSDVHFFLHVFCCTHVELLFLELVCLCMLSTSGSSWEMKCLNLLVQAVYLWFYITFHCSVAVWPRESSERWMYHVISLQLVFAVHSSINIKRSYQRCTITLGKLHTVVKHLNGNTSKKICWHHFHFQEATWAHHITPTVFCSFVLISHEGARAEQQLSCMTVLLWAV